MRSVVVLPEPEGPSSTKNSPGSIARSTPCSTVVAPWRLTTASRRTLALALVFALVLVLVLVPVLALACAVPALIAGPRL